MNAIVDVVIVFYDADEIWTDKENNIVRQETFKFTHTWKKYTDNWVILGGMAAKKNQDIPNDYYIKDKITADNTFNPLRWIS